MKSVKYLDWRRNLSARLLHKINLGLYTKVPGTHKMTKTHSHIHTYIRTHILSLSLYLSLYLSLTIYIYICISASHADCTVPCLSLSLTLVIHSNHPSQQAGPQEGIQCLHWTDGCKSLTIREHWSIYVHERTSLKGSSLSRQYPAKYMTDITYTTDQALLIYSLEQTKSQRHSTE